MKCSLFSYLVATISVIDLGFFPIELAVSYLPCAELPEPLAGHANRRCYGLFGNHDPVSCGIVPVLGRTLLSDRY